MLVALQRTIPLISNLPLDSSQLPEETSSVFNSVIETDLPINVKTSFYDAFLRASWRKEAPAAKGAAADCRYQVNLNLPCLENLCAYDSQNGTVYALTWAQILNGIACIAAAGADLAQPSARYWLTLEKIGTTLFLQRQPKDFSAGLHLNSLEIILQTSRAVSLLTTPLAIVLAGEDSEVTVSFYIAASDLLKKLARRQLEPLSMPGQPLDRNEIYQDFNHWIYNSSLRGRSGQSGDQSISCAEFDVDRVVARLREFDTVCATDWADFAVTVFDRLDSFARKRTT